MPSTAVESMQLGAPALATVASAIAHAKAARAGRREIPANERERREVLQAAYVRSAKAPFEVDPLMEDADNDDAGCRRPEVGLPQPQ